MCWKGVDTINQNQAHVAWIRKFSVLADPLSTDTGALTATMKIKRKAVFDRHRDVVEKMYAGRLRRVWQAAACS